MPGPSFNPVPSSIQISRMLRRPPTVGGIAFKPGVTGLKPPTLKPLGLRRADGGAIPDHPQTPVIGAINTPTLGRADAHPTHVPPGSYVMPADIVSHIGDGNTAAGQQILAKMFLPLSAQTGSQVALMGAGAPYGGGGAPFGAESPDLKRKRMPPPEGIQPHVVGLPKYPVYAGPGQQGPDFVQAHGGVVHGEPGGQFLSRMGMGEGEKPGTPINISGGEFVVPPDEVKRRGRGDVNRGHEILDAWVRHLRQEHIKTLKNLPGPAT
jgi:hypothetical protein